MSGSARHIESEDPGAGGPDKGMTSGPLSEKKYLKIDHTSPSHQSVNRSSPTAVDVLAPPSAIEKKPLTNGHASPVRHPGNSSQSQTDDRMRLARERREEREKTLAMREQALMEKERRSRLQYERTREERWRRLEEQRQKEEQRRAAVEEKRRQQLEEEKERLEALMRKSLERSLQLESRNRRGNWGINGQSDYALSHDPFASSPAPNELSNVPSSPQRSVYYASPSRRRANTVAMEMGGTNSTPSTPKKERLRTNQRTPIGSPVRRLESSEVIHCAASPQLSPKSQNVSPTQRVPLSHYPPSPLRHKPSTTLTDEKKIIANRQTQELRSHDPGVKKPVSDPEVSVVHMSGICKPESLKPADRNAERSPEHSPLTDGKAGTGTTDRVEGSRILVERQRLNYIQKEQEEKDRLKAEQLEKLQVEKEEKKRKADEEKELQEKQEVERELMKQQEEQERQQRKKRIEEIMKRTRKGDGELKREDSQELYSPPSHTRSLTPSPPGEVRVTAKVNGDVKVLPIGAQDKLHIPESIIKQQSVEKSLHTPAQVLHNTPSLHSTDPNGTAVKVHGAPVTPQRSSSVKEKQNTEVRKINNPSEKLQETLGKVPAENYGKKPVKDGEQGAGHVINPERTQIIKEEIGGQVKRSSYLVKQPTSQLGNSPGNNQNTQQVHSQVNNPTAHQENIQGKNLTSQQMKSQLKGPTTQQVNPINNPTEQQINSPVKGSSSQQLSSPVKSPTYKQMNIQVKSPNSQQVNSPVNSPTAQQVNSQIKSTTSQQMNSTITQQVNTQGNNPAIQQMSSQLKSLSSKQANSLINNPNDQQVSSQVKSPAYQQVKSPNFQQVNSPTNSSTAQQMKSPVKSSVSQIMTCQMKDPNSQPLSNQEKTPTFQQMNSLVQNSSSQQMNSPAKTPTSQQLNNQVKGSTIQQVNSQVKSPTPQQVNIPANSPTDQQRNSPVKIPTYQVMTSHMKSPSSQQVSSQLKTLTSQQVCSQVKASSSQQVNGSVQNSSAQQVNNLVKSQTAQQVNSPTKAPASQQVKSPVKSPLTQQVNSSVKGPTYQQTNNQFKPPNSKQVNSQVQNTTSQEVNSSVESLTSQKVTVEVMCPNSRVINSQVNSPFLKHVNSHVKKPLAQEVNSQVKTPTFHEEPSQMKKPANQQMNSPVKSEQVNGDLSSQMTAKKTLSSSSPLRPPPASQFSPPLRNQEYIETEGRDRKESAEEVQLMEVSPVSKEDLISMPKFSPISEAQNVVNSTQALEDLLDLTGHVTFPIMPYNTAHGDHNKNVIEPKESSKIPNMRSRKE